MIWSGGTHFVHNLNNHDENLFFPEKHEICTVVTVYTLDRMEILNMEYLWLNLVGCLLVMSFGWLFSLRSKNS